MTDNEIDILKNELEHEKTCRDSAAWQNGELEKQIMSIQEELRKSDYPWDGDDDLVRENNKHKQVMECIESLRDQLPILREKIKNAKVCGIDCKLKHDDLNINLDILTPAELLRTVKRFERLKTDLISTLRSKEWRLDSESKLFVRVNDQRTYLQNELLICQNNILRLQKNGPYWQNVPRKNDERVLDPKRGPIKKMFSERLPPIPTQ
ncbi:uncharacterized protein LOC114355987 isoform X3 [Ostrinia furnacalis]|uniref:uncharacterized protein LOC114355987 isoform X2 n=1 Tax=Ostrinia furnacalis TaxID=93504 RepID=UPI001038FA61|nr:uncharacterized protein LOC114355987 isoform X2 [Ostrinia furnacalis]XP_028164858.1 uncharacterized protein LOC114355987 isoform X3 [Ostrinia furnacalis]